MPGLYSRLDRKKGRDIRVLARFVQIYCRENHRGAEKRPLPVDGTGLGEVLGEVPELCPGCLRLLQHGIAKRLQCPYDPKPMCKKCPTPCYAPGYRERMRQVMRFSGLYLIRHGRLDLMLHYFL